MTPATSLAFLTDIMLLSLQGSTVERREGHRVVHTPTNPTFRWGNFILLDAAPRPGTVSSWIDSFAREFPHADYVAIGIDEPSGIGVSALSAGLRSAGLDVDASPVMTATVVPAPREVNRGTDIRLLNADDDADWDAAIALQEANNVDEEPGAYRTFLLRRMAGLRTLQRQGHGAWLGAFADDSMVSGLGIFSDGQGVARYQNVDTHPDYRRRGLAAALVREAGDYALHALNAQTLVIVADLTNGADRVYRSLGFTETETQLQLDRHPHTV